MVKLKVFYIKLIINVRTQVMLMRFIKKTIKNLKI